MSTELTTIGTEEERPLSLAVQGLETRFAMATRQRELLETYIKDRLKPEKHYYKFSDDPNQKPSLTKEGAELICLPHALKPRYTILSGPNQPPTDNSPYQITICCGLWRGDAMEGEGLGSASSYITVRDGKHKARQNDPGLCHNATIKMASKSAYIAATLNSTAASEFFTQDMEDDQMPHAAQEKPTRWCSKHQQVWFKKGNMKNYAHPTEDGKWCNEPTQSDPSAKADFQFHEIPKEAPGGHHEGETTTPNPEAPPQAEQPSTLGDLGERVKLVTKCKDGIKAIGCTEADWLTGHGYDIKLWGLRGVAELQTILKTLEGEYADVDTKVHQSSFSQAEE